MHYGIKGMKWGIRRTPEQLGNKDSSETKKEKLHLGLDKHGNINLIRGKTTSAAKKAFAVKTALAVASISLNMYMSLHPEVIESGQKVVSSALKAVGKRKIA